MLNLRQLRYFVAIVDAGSLSRAALTLHIAQPALSQQIANLEREVGTELLSRSVRGVVPTDPGKALYRHAQTLLKLAAETINVAQRAGADVSGRVRVGLPSSIAMILAAPLLASLRERYPGILVELYESLSTYLAPQLFEGRVDLVVLVDRSPSRSLVEKALVSECIYFVQSRAKNSLSGSCEISLGELARIPLILTTRVSTLRHILDAAFLEAGVVPTVVAEASSMQTLLAVVAQGRIGTLVPSSALSWNPAHRALERYVIEPRIVRGASLAWSRTAPMTEATQCVRDTLIEVTQALVRTRKWLGTMLSDPASPSVDQAVEKEGNAGAIV
jgi:LysR family nitrogen assimilation transcriptional regulator